MEIIAEIGINHNNNLDIALQLIQDCAKAGANIAKFQYYKADFLYPKNAGKLEWKDNNKTYSYDIYEASKKYELSDEWIDILIQKCKECNIEFMASVFHKEGLDFLIKKGMKKIKIASSNITNLPLIEECAKTKLPLYISTGGANLSEVCEAVDVVLKYHNNLVLLQCNLDYPVSLDNVNLGVLETYKKAFGVKVGFSDHTKEIYEAAEQALYLGADVIEKHVTFDKTAQGPDHFFALDMSELKLLVNKIKQAQKNLENNNYEIDKKLYGKTQKVCLDFERGGREFGYPSLFVNRDIKKGEIITQKDILILRVAKRERGLEPKYLNLFIQNKIKATKEIKAFDSIKWETIF